MDAMDDMLLGEFDPEVDRERNAEFQRDLAAFQVGVGQTVNFVKTVFRMLRKTRLNQTYGFKFPVFLRKS